MVYTQASLKLWIVNLIWKSKHFLLLSYKKLKCPKIDKDVPFKKLVDIFLSIIDDFLPHFLSQSAVCNFLWTFLLCCVSSYRTCWNNNTWWYSCKRTTIVFFYRISLLFFLLLFSLTMFAIQIERQLWNTKLEQWCCYSFFLHVSDSVVVSFSIHHFRYISEYLRSLFSIAKQISIQFICNKKYTSTSIN